MITWRELLKRGEKELFSAGIEDSSFDAFQLLLKVSGYTKDSFYLNDNKYCDDVSETVYSELITRRKNNEPLQYILGKWEFLDNEFLVGEGVLIPRPETEELTEHIVKLIKDNGLRTVYDLCSGSGCIGLSVAKAFPDVRCYLFELYDNAFEFSLKNLMNLNIPNAEVLKLDVLKGPDLSLPDADIIVSNPPYIASCEIPMLQSEVLKEPVTALDGGNDGLMFYRAIHEKWLVKLSDYGYIAFECGEDQSKAIADLYSDKFDCKTVYDSYGADRFVIGRKKLKEKEYL